MALIEIQTREVAVCLVTYQIEAETVEDASEAVKTGTLRYEEIEIINRDVEKIISADVSLIH